MGEGQLHPHQSRNVTRIIRERKRGGGTKDQKIYRKERGLATGAVSVSERHAPLLIRLICPSWMLLLVLAQDREKSETSAKELTQVMMGWENTAVLSVCVYIYIFCICRVYIWGGGTCM